MKKEHYTIIQKTRITPRQNKGLEQVAKSTDKSISAIVRKAIDEQLSSTDYTRKVKLNCYKNAIYNRISILSIPKKAKKTILEVLNENE